MKRSIGNLIRMTIFLALNLAFLAGLPAQTADQRLVSADWLQNNLNLPNLRVIDMRADIRDYWSGHIPGAVYLDETALRWPQNGVPGRLIPVEVLVRLLEEWELITGPLSSSIPRLIIIGRPTWPGPLITSDTRAGPFLTVVLTSGRTKTGPSPRIIPAWAGPVMVRRSILMNRSGLFWTR